MMLLPPQQRTHQQLTRTRNDSHLRQHQNTHLTCEHLRALSRDRPATQEEEEMEEEQERGEGEGEGKEVQGEGEGEGEGEQEQEQWQEE
jgi:hypothetical protein